MSGDLPVTTSLSVRDYLSVLRRRRRLLAAVVLAGILLSAAYALLAPRKWTSTAEVEVRPVNQSLTAASSVAPDKLLTMSTEQQVASSADVAIAAGRILRSSETAEQLLKQVSVSNPAGTVVLVFDYTGSSPRAAQAGAEAFARAYLNQRRARYAQQVSHETALIDAQLATLKGRSGTSGQRAALAGERAALLTLDTTPGSFNQNATLPIAPSSPHVKLVVVVGTFLGLFLGILAAFARDAADPRLRDGAELADRLGRPTLAELPALPVLWRGGARVRSGMVLVDAPKSRQAAALRLLRSRLLLAGMGRGRNVVLVTSPTRTSGKSVVAANIASGLAESGASVLLLSADGQTPSPQAIFGPDAAHGSSGTGVEVRAPQWDGGGALRVLPVAAEEGPSLHSSGALARLVAGLRGGPVDGAGAATADRAVADVVVIDCPPLLDDTDALPVVQHADLVVVVAGPATTRPELARLDELIAEAGVPVLGGIFDRSRARSERPTTPVTGPAQAGPAGWARPAPTPTVPARPVAANRAGVRGR